MAAPRFTTWTDAERRVFLIKLVRGERTTVSARTWRRWRERARRGMTLYQTFVDDLNRRVKTAWTDPPTPPKELPFQDAELKSQ